MIDWLHGLVVYISCYLVQLPGGAALNVHAIPLAAACVVSVSLYRNGERVAKAMHKANVGNAALAGVVDPENITRQGLTDFESVALPYNS